MREYLRELLAETLFYLAGLSAVVVATYWALTMLTQIPGR